MVAVKFPVANDVVVLTIVVGAVAKLSKDDSHLNTLPVFSDRFNVVPDPVQTAVLAIVPPTEVGFTVTVDTAEFVAGHTPLCTTAL